MKKPLITKKKDIEDPKPKRNYQTKDNFIVGIGSDGHERIFIEVRRKGNKISEIPSKFSIENITATSFESAIAQTKRIARKQYNSTNTKIIQFGIELRKCPKWSIKLKLEAPFLKDKVKARKYKNGKLYSRKH